MPRIARISSAGARIAIVLISLFALVPGSAPAQTAAPKQPASQDYPRLLDFLRNARIVENEAVGIGTTAPRRLILEDGGERLRAAFRDVDETHERQRLADGSYYQRLRDFSGYEVAVYRLSRVLGMDSVPPAAHRTIDRVDGTVQLWVEDTMMEGERIQQDLRPPSALDWSRQLQEMYVFDELIGNIDRNTGNMLIDKDWNVWLIDHTRAFQQGDKLRDPGRIRMIRQGFWDALQSLERSEVEEAISHDVDGRGINDVMTRRDLLVEHISGLIAERGAGAVVWE
jgi:hypothetical protein